MSHKITHLEFVQNIITRMNTNSFIIKGWAITLVSALFALAAKDADRLYVLIAYVPIPMFWIMDGFYLSKERQFRDLYKRITSLDELNINFLMETGEYNQGRNTWCSSLISTTIWPFYGALIIVTLIVMFVIF